MYAGETISLTVTAPNGCKASDTHTIQSLPIPAPVISASGPLNCAGDSVTLSASGLLPGTSYQWSNGASTASIRVAPEGPTAYILTATRSGCVGISNVLMLTPPTALSMMDTLVQPRCYGTATGRIGIGVAGGTLPYVYVWSNGASTASINNLRAGTYGVTVTDGKGCSLVESFLLGEPAKMQLALTKLGENDCPTRNLKIKASSSNGVGRVLYRLDELAYDTTSTWAVSEGLNKVWAKDSLGCEVWDTVRLKEKPALDLQVIVENDLADCITGNVGVRLLARHARGALVFSTAEGETLDSVFVSGSRFVKIYALDSLGCRDSAILNVNDDFPNNWWSHTLIGDQDCISGNSSIQVSLGAGLSGVPTLQLEGKAPKISSQIDSLRGGFYFLRIQWQDCIDSTGIEVDEKLPRINNYEWLKLDDCQLGNAGIRIKADTSDGPIRYRLNNGSWQNSPVFDSLSSGSYTASIINALGCIDSLQVLVVADVLPGIESVKQSTSCDTADGEILFRLDYGTVAYQYSINGGSTWQNSPRFVGLAPGVYHPVRRSLQGDCQEQLDSIRIGTVDCAGGPVAYFLQDLINLNEDNQIAQIRLEVAAPAWFQGPYAVKVRLEGDGSPHLDLGTRTNANQVELRNDTSQVAYEQVYNFSGPGVQQATLTVPLQEEAYLYRFPSDYLFHLEPAVGAKILVDPQRDLTKVTVNFYGPTSEEIIEVDLCEPCGVLGKGYTIPTAKCYLWEKQTNGNTSELRVCQAGEYTRYALDNSLKVIKKTIYRVRIANLSLKIEEVKPSTLSCQASNRKLKAMVLPSDLADKVNYLWSTGSETPETNIAQGITEYAVTVTDPATKCTVNGSIQIQPKAKACEIKDYFYNRGFFAIPITILGPQTSTSPELRSVNCELEPCGGRSGICVRDDAKLIFKILDEQVAVADLDATLRSTLNSFSGVFAYNNAKAFVTKNDLVCDCNGFIANGEARLSNSELGYWLHIYDGSACGEDDILFIKGRLPDGREYPLSSTEPFLQAGLDHFNRDLNQTSPQMVHSVMDLILPNFTDPKDPLDFSKAPAPAALTRPEESAEQLLCTDALQPKSVPVITPSGHLVMLPKNSIWRFEMNDDLKGKMWEGGILCGFTEIAEGKVQGVYKGRYQASNLRFVGYHKAGTQLLGGWSDAVNISKAFEVPSSNPARVYLGKLVVIENTESGCSRAYQIRSALVNASIPYRARPAGTIVKTKAQIGTFSDEKDQPNGFYKICQTQLKDVVEGIKSLEDISVYYNFTENSMLYCLNPNGSKDAIDWLLIRVEEGQKTYYQWNCILGIWETVNAPTDVAAAQKIQRLYDLFYEKHQGQTFHDILGVAGFIPIIGDLVDVVEAVAYLVEGNYGAFAGAAMIALLPAGLDYIGKTAKLSSRFAKLSGKIKGMVRVSCGSVPPGFVETSNAACRPRIFRALGRKSYELYQKALKKAGLTDEATDFIEELLSKGPGLGDDVLAFLADNTDKVDDLMAIYKKGFDELGKNADELRDFIKDAIANPDFFKALAKNPNLVRSYKLLISNPALRLDPDRLRAIDDYLGLNLKSFDDIAKELKDLDINDWADFIDDLGPIPSQATKFWQLGWGARGFALENLAITKFLSNGFQNFPRNFPTIDHWDNITRVITSIKSLNLDAKTYKNIDAFRSKIERYLKNLEDYVAEDFSGIRVPPVGTNIQGRELLLIFPFHPTGEQLSALVNLRNIYSARGITLRFEVL